MSIVLYIIISIAIVVMSLAIWIKVSIWIMSLGVTDDNKIDWPWKKDD